MTDPLPLEAGQCLSRPDSQEGASGADREKGEHMLLEADTESVEVGAGPPQHRRTGPPLRGPVPPLSRIGGHS